MTDRELIELAAKVAGIDGVQYFESTDARKTGLYSHEEGLWNPLTQSIDAFHLAVKLRMNIEHNHPADSSRWVAADRNGCEGCYAPVSCVEDEFEESQRAEATRRAITRAAAKIGEKMK